MLPPVVVQRRPHRQAGHAGDHDNRRRRDDALRWPAARQTRSDRGRSRHDGATGRRRLGPRSILGGGGWAPNKAPAFRHSLGTAPIPHVAWIWSLPSRRPRRLEELRDWTAKLLECQ